MVETSARKWGNRKKGLSQQRPNFTNRNLALTRWFVGNTIYFSLCLKSPKKKLEHCERSRFILGILQKLEINSELDFAEVSLK